MTAGRRVKFPDLRRTVTLGKLCFESLGGSAVKVPVGAALPGNAPMLTTTSMPVPSRRIGVM